MMSAFDRMDFDQALVFEIFRILSVILNLGNIRLQDSPDHVRIAAVYCCDEVYPLCSKHSSTNPKVRGSLI